MNLLQRSRQWRPWVWVVLGLLSLVILTLSLAPIQGSAQRAGASYSRSPDGYGAWYQYMQTQTEVCIGRWHTPLNGLTAPGILLQIYPDLSARFIPDSVYSWVTQGNTLIMLGFDSSLTHAPFTSEIESDAGSIKIETRRRERPSQHASAMHSLLSDRHGSIVWQWQEGKGTVIASVTPYFAANAYQDEPGNFKFLAQLATPATGVLWIDESQRRPLQSPPTEPEPKAEQNQRSPACQRLLAQANPQAQPVPEAKVEDPLLYLLKTPIGLVLLQGGVVLILLIVSQNRRFGHPQPLNDTTSDNTSAYIQALATVLQKAKSHDFVVNYIQKAEQRYVQQRLGLGTTLLDPAQVLEAWEQLGYPTATLRTALTQPPRTQSRDVDVLNWLEAWRQVRVALSQI